MFQSPISSPSTFLCEFFKGRPGQASFILALLKCTAGGGTTSWTPGSLQAGGAVALHRAGLPMADLQWKRPAGSRLLLARGPRRQHPANSDGERSRELQSSISHAAIVLFCTAQRTARAFGCLIAVAGRVSWKCSEISASLSIGLLVPRLVNLRAASNRAARCCPNLITLHWQRSCRKVQEWQLH